MLQTSLLHPLSVCASGISYIQLKNSKALSGAYKGPGSELKWVSLGWDPWTPLWTAIFRLRLKGWEGARETRVQQNTQAKGSLDANPGGNFRKEKAGQHGWTQWEGDHRRYSQKGQPWLGVVAQAFNTSTWKTETSGSLCVQGQTGLRRVPD